MCCRVVCVDGKLCDALCACSYAEEQVFGQGKAELKCMAPDCGRTLLVFALLLQCLASPIPLRGFVSPFLQWRSR